MPAKRKQTVRRGLRSWIVPLLMLAALIVSGFAFGLVAGIIWEEPGLAYAYFSGETEEVAWSVSSTEPAPAVSAAAQTPAPSEAPGAPARAPAPAADGPASAAPAAPSVPHVAAGPRGEFAVQVGAFASSQAADGLASDLRAKGFDVYVSPGTKAGESRWRVRVGPVTSRAAAEKTADRLKQVEKLPTWVLQEDAS